MVDRIDFMLRQETLQQVPLHNGSEYRNDFRRMRVFLLEADQFLINRIERIFRQLEQYQLFRSKGENLPAEL